MRKLPNDLENPIDNIMYKMIEYIAPGLYKLGFTPNILTTLGNISTLIFVYFMFQYNFKMAALFYLLSYIFDCLDGYIARSYNMVSKFGDWYDHISDALKTLLYFYALFKINRKLGALSFVVVFALLFLTCIYLSHQEIYYNKPESSYTLDVLKCLSFGANPSNVNEYLKITRYFGCGTTYLVMILIILFYKKE